MKKKNRKANENAKPRKKSGGKWLVIIGAIAVVLAIVLFVPWGLKHIEDTNGPDNYNLTQITDQDIIENKMGALRPCGKRDAVIGSGVVIKSKKFTGVYELFYGNFLFNSDIHVELNDFEIKEGNFVMAVVHDGQIVSRIQPDEYGTAKIDLEDINGHVSVMIAGESADYKFSMSGVDYEVFENRIDE